VRRAQDHKALLFGGKGMIADPDWLLRRAHALDASWWVPPGVPHPGFAKIDADATMTLQGCGKLIEDEPGALRLTDSINVIQIGKKVLPRPQGILDLLEGRVLAERI